MAFFLVVLTVWVWSPALRFGFVYDDHLQIESNPQLQSWNSISQALHEPLWTQLGHEKASPYYRPLFLLVLFAERSSFDLNAYWWHLVSICFHTVAVVTLFLFLYLHLGKPVPGLVAAAIFACSPIATEVVCWVSSCSESVYAALFLCALCCLSLSSRTKMTAANVSLRLCAGFLLSLAIFAKETAVMAVALTIAYDVLFLPGKLKLARILSYAPVLVPVIAHLWIHPELVPADNRSLAQVFSMIPYFCWLAIRKLIWPLPVSEFYDLWFEQAYSHLSLALVFGALICTGGGMLWFGSKSRLIAWISAVITLPVIAVLAGIFVFRDYDLFHDRYLYLSEIGVAMLLAILIAKADLRSKNGRSWRFAMVACATLAVGVEFTQSRLAVQQFRNDTALFSHAVEVAPNNIVALQLQAETALGTADCPVALEAYQRAEQLRPDLWKTSFFEGIGYLRCARYGLAADAFRHAAAVSSANAEQAALAWYELGRVDLLQEDVDGALISLRRAASLDPGSRKIQMLISQLTRVSN